MNYNNPHGKYVTIDPRHPKALGICDLTGFVFRRQDLVKQMEWRGNALVWTGFYVGKPFLDTPNEQNRPPILPPDPVPVVDPRLQQPTVLTWSIGIPENWQDVQAFSWSSWSGQDDGSNALPENQRLSLLQQAYWGSS